MLVRRIHVAVVYFVIVVYLHLFRWKEPRDLLHDELLEMLLGCGFLFCNCCVFAFRFCKPSAALIKSLIKLCCRCILPALI